MGDRREPYALPHALEVGGLGENVKPCPSGQDAGSRWPSWSICANGRARNLASSSRWTITNAPALVSAWQSAPQASTRSSTAKPLAPTSTSASSVAPARRPVPSPRSSITRVSDLLSADCPALFLEELQQVVWAARALPCHAARLPSSE